MCKKCKAGQIERAGELEDGRKVRRCTSCGLCFLDFGLTSAEVKAFLNYFYRVEEWAQREGYNTSEYFTVRVDRAHEKLMKMRG